MSARRSTTSILIGESEDEFARDSPIAIESSKEETLFPTYSRLTARGGEVAQFQFEAAASGHLSGPRAPAKWIRSMRGLLPRMLPADADRSFKQRFPHRRYSAF